MRLLSPDLWLKQAKSDRTASGLVDLPECHRRYLLQQAYEKSVKALGLALLPRKSAKDKRVRAALGDCFLHHHTPMTIFLAKDDTTWGLELRGAYGGDWQQILKILKGLRQMIALNMGAEADTQTVDAWTKIDGTRPTKKSDAVSYRYPFVDDAHPDGITPHEWTGWGTYQGEEDVVRRAVDNLIARAGQQIAEWNRST